MSASRSELTPSPRCVLCDREAEAIEWERKVETLCLGSCGHYSMSRDAMTELTELSGAGRAVVGEALRYQIVALRHYNPDIVPILTAIDVRAAATRRA